MALEDLTGSNKYIANLVNTNPLSADDRREGDDHIRGIKNVLLNTFPALGGPVDFSSYVRKQGDTMVGTLNVPMVIAGGGAPVNSNGVIQFRNDTGIFVGSIGCNVGSGYGDSIGINVGNATGEFGVFSNTVRKVTVLPAQTSLQNTTIFLLTADLRIATLPTTASAANLFIDPGFGYVYRSTSSRRYKKDIRPFGDSSFLYSLNPITYLSASDVDKGKGRHCGLIAEEVHDVAPSLVSYLEGNPDGVQYDRLVVPIIAEIKRLHLRIEALEILCAGAGNAAI